ncbi:MULTISPECIES: hypothetical protein [Olivibacter]|uniref:Uncharacterized protein n=1 Tax=Olivibacter jilunii TaxID=985016 RepID=A0ABW6B3Q6_9SPHI
MEKRTKGAWIIHHSKKINSFNNVSKLEDIQLSGKCGVFLSNLAASNEESFLSKEQVDILAESSNINKKLELPAIKQTLKDAHLIDVSANGSISVLGLTSEGILNHTAELFDSNEGLNYQNASIEIADLVSEKPLHEKFIKEYISDRFALSSAVNDTLFLQVEELGILDYKNIDNAKTYFNGNLFQKSTIEKSNKIFETLSNTDKKNIQTVDDIMKREGCISLENAERILTTSLLAKLRAIAFYDFNEVSNFQHSKIYLTKPSSFAKYGNPFEEDVLDLAKAFISSLIYGLQVSNKGRGKMQDYEMIKNTLRKLLRGELVGPCTAIGQDYHLLEFHRVIELIPDTGTMYYMRLLKFDVALIALEVLQTGEVAQKTTLDISINSSNVTTYKGPSEMRSEAKKKSSIGPDIGEMLRTLRNS